MFLFKDYAGTYFMERMRVEILSQYPDLNILPVKYLLKKRNSLKDNSIVTC